MLVWLLAAAVASALDSSHSLASERSSIESTYELTKYLEYQLKEIKDIYVSYRALFYILYTIHKHKISMKRIHE